jgi:hypothetical protein
MPKGLIIAIGKPKKEMEKEALTGDSENHEEEMDFDSFAADAFAALKADDEEGFKTALRGAVEACSA